MLKPMNELLKVAKKEGYGIAAPNVFALCNVRAIYETALEMKTPLIIGVPGSRDLEEIADLARFYERRWPEAQVAINLDHGGSFEQIMTALHAGFTSVMIDRSTMSFEDNVRETAEVVKIAHAMGACVEAELGHVGMAFEYDETRDAGLTRKEEAEEFVRRTGVDCLAVAVGTSHGLYKGTPHLEIELLRELSSMLEIPLVLHGGSGTGDELLRAAVENGIQKINLATDVNYAGTDALRQYIKTAPLPAPGVKAADLPGAEKAMKVGYKEMLAHYVKVFGSEGKA